ncbi:hypothetical protein JCM11641_005009 [Rhodosporidiobolus odoratus]
MPSEASRHRGDRSRSPDSNRHRSSRRHHSRSRSRSPRRSATRDDRDSQARDDSDRQRKGDRARGSRRSSRRDRDQSASEDEVVHLPHGAGEIGEEDYFIKATELKLWLWEEKGKKLDSLKTEDARRYFKKFCRAWNKGRLSDAFYAGVPASSLPSSISTTHSWSFSKASQSDLDAAASIRKSIDTGSKTRSYSATAGPAPGPSYSSSSSSSVGPTARGPQLGPAMPPSSAVERLQMERDARDSILAADRSAASSERRRDARESRQDERDSRATGRDRLQEKRREGNASRREFEKGREGGGMIEFDDEALLNGETGKGGPAGSFQEAVRQRERAKERREERRGGKDEERKVEM